MSVNHYLLPIADAELRSLVASPESCHDFVNAREDRVVSLFTSGCAITALIAEDENDPLAFLRVGAPDEFSGWIGEYAEEDGRVAKCQVDMGYGPAWYCANEFVVKIADKLEEVTETDFANWFDADWLQDNHVYPSGWHEEGVKEFTVECFHALRQCVLAAAHNGDHLLIWCA